MSAYHASGMVIQDDADWTSFAENVVKQRVADTDRQTLRLRWAGVFLLVMLIAGLGWFVYHFVRQKASMHGDLGVSPKATAFVGDAVSQVPYFPVSRELNPLPCRFSSSGNAALPPHIAV
jgi:hypothetical protein